MTKAAIPLAELPPAARKAFLKHQGRKHAPRRTTFPKDRARTWAIRVLAIVADLTPDQRARVLQLAARMNNV